MPLSAQQLIDCDLIPNMGCLGGEAKFAYRYVLNNGLALESDYPYTNRLRECKYLPIMSHTQIGGFKVFQHVLNEDLKTLVC